MSLINDMLADLETRRGGHAPAGVEVLDGVRVTPPSDRGHAARSGSRLLLTVMLAAAAACAAWYAMNVLYAGHRVTAGSPAALAPAAVSPPPTVTPQTTTPPQTTPAPQPLASAVVEVATGDPAAVLLPADPIPAAVPGAAEPAPSDPVQPRTLSATQPPQDRVTAPPSATGAPATAASASVQYRGSVQKADITAPVTPQSELAALLRRASDVPAWREELTTFVAANPDLHSARTALVQAYLRVDNRLEAEALLRDGLARAPGHLEHARLLAHLLVARGEQEAALVTLTVLPRAALDAESKAFIAALQQRLGRHGDAIATYREALNVAPRRGAWWVGLGISLSADSQVEPAQRAFRQALNDRELSPNLRQFAETQINRLGQTSKSSS